MAQGFNMGFRSQREWGWLLAIWIFLSGSGSGLFLLYVFYSLPLQFAMLSLGAVILGGAVLLLELGSPLRAWLSLSRLGTSWLSRGALSVVLFVICGVLSIASASSVADFLWPDGGAIGKGLFGIAALSALMITLYPGFFLARNRSIPFWNTALFPVISFGFAIMGASGLALLASVWLGEGMNAIASLAAIVIVLDFFLFGIHLISMWRAGGAARESVRLLTGGPLNWAFWGGVVLVGMLVPLVIVLGTRSAAALAGACILIGAFFFRYCTLKAGVYVPAAVLPEGMDMSRLKRTSADLMREYAGMATGNANRRG